MMSQRRVRALAGAIAASLLLTTCGGGGGGGNGLTPFPTEKTDELPPGTRLRGGDDLTDRDPARPGQSPGRAARVAVQSPLDQARDGGLEEERVAKIFLDQTPDVTCILDG